MQNYLHQDHAGNHGDLLKHWLLVEVIQQLQRNSRPLTYIDTHAGAGLYFLDRNSRKAVNQIDWQQHPGVQSLHTLIAEDLTRNRYPGSPVLVKRLLRDNDQAHLFETNPDVIKLLRENCGNIEIQQQDGYTALDNLVVKTDYQVLVLIDPPYIDSNDYQKAIELITQIHQRLPQAIQLLWYPLLAQNLVNELAKGIQQSPVSSAQLFEMSIAETGSKGMNGSGIIAINPPAELADSFKATIPALSAELAADNASRYRFEPLTN